VQWQLAAHPGHIKRVAAETSLSLLTRRCDFRHTAIWSVARGVGNTHSASETLTVSEKASPRQVLRKELKSLRITPSKEGLALIMATPDVSSALMLA
jgi:hypothetical protein